MNKYEVFLSFKNSDEDGKDTEDKVMAQELYEALVSHGIGVFYSNETLSIIGTAQYKAAIDNALDEAKVLVAIGTSKENINSNWVRYEWDGFFGDVLSGKKDGQVFSYIDGMNVLDLPRSLRQLQCFERKKDSLESICKYIKNALGEERAAKEVAEDKGQITGSMYSYLQNKESERLSSQANLVADNDVQLLTPIVDELSQKSSVHVLDLGCADGYLTKKVFGKFDEKITSVVGVDHEKKCIEVANNNHLDNYSFYQLDLEGDSFEDRIEQILVEQNISGFDLVFCTLVLHHLNDPQKLLRRLRRFINKGGYVYIRSCDDSETIAYPDEDNLLRKTVESIAKLPGMSDRIHGRKVYSEVFKAGYKNIMVKPYLVTTAEMDIDDRVQFFFDMFYWPKNRLKLLLEKEPENENWLNLYTKYCVNYEELEDRFYEPSFYFKVSGPILIAQR